MAGLSCKLFADDSPLIEVNNDFNNLINKFQNKIKALTNWCEFSKVEINWDKTFAMFVTNKRIKKPELLNFDNITIKVVRSF